VTSSETEGGAPPAQPTPQPQVTGMRVVAMLAIVACIGAAFVLGRSHASTSAGERIESRPTPNVVLAMHDVSRLEAETFHMEKVIELTDE
jgi:hypothetical protein